MSVLMMSLLAASIDQVSVERTARAQARLQSNGIAVWQPSDIVCDNGQTLPGSTLHLVERIQNRPFLREPENFTFSFTLGPDGRAGSITKTSPDQRRNRETDHAPAIAGTAFPKMDAETNCTVTFTKKVTIHEEASVEDFVLHRIMDRNARIRREDWDVHFPGDCRARPYRRPLLQAYPDFRAIPKTKGGRDWVILSYSSDEEGRANGIEVVGSSGNAELDAAGVDALSRSQYTGGARTGCAHYYYTGSDVVEAPAIPEAVNIESPMVACDADGRWEREPKLTYPENFRKRGIEGWAVLRFDVAPWGEIGGVEVVDAQPATELGEAAQKVLRSAKFKPLDTGLKGCIETVRFVLPETPESLEADAVLEANSL